MAVREDARLDDSSSSINTALMDDVLRVVFSKLETKEEKDAFGLVCKRWLRFQNTERRRLRIRSGLKMLRRMAVRFSDIIELDMSRTASGNFPVKLSPAYLSAIATGFPLLRDLNLSKYKGLSDALLITLGNVLPRLHSLDVSRCPKLTDRGLIAVAKRCRNLRRLHLSHCRSITDDLLQALSQRSSHLEDLKLNGCYKITDSGIICLVEGCRQIKCLDVTSCRNIGDAGISRVAEVCSSSLKVLKLSYCNVVDKSILSLTNSRCMLTTLFIDECSPISDEPVRSLALSCYQSLKFLSLYGCYKITDLTLSCIFSNCRYLTALDIGGYRNITDAAFQGLTSGDFASVLKVLKALYLPRITVAAIRMMLEFCKCLDYLVLWGCPRASRQSCEETGIQFPDSCEVDFMGYFWKNAAILDMLF